MARGKIPPKPISKVLSVPEMRQAIRKIQRRLEDLAKLNPEDVEHWDSQSDSVISKIADTLADIFGDGTVEYQRWNVYSLDHGPISMGVTWGNGHGRRTDRRHYWKEAIAEAKTKLQSCIDMLNEKIEDAGETFDTTGAGRIAPAADRLVRLDHNSASYNDVMSRLNEIHAELRGANSNEEQRSDAELMASIALLRGPEVRPDLLERIVVPPLIWLSQQFAGKVVGNPALALLKAIAAWFGFTIPF